MEVLVEDEKKKWVDHFAKIGDVPGGENLHWGAHLPIIWKLRSKQICITVPVHTQTVQLHYLHGQDKFKSVIKTNPTPWTSYATTPTLQ